MQSSKEASWLQLKLLYCSSKTFSTCYLYGDSAVAHLHRDRESFRLERRSSSPAVNRILGSWESQKHCSDLTPLPQLRHSAWFIWTVVADQGKRSLWRMSGHDDCPGHMHRCPSYPTCTLWVATWSTGFPPCIKSFFYSLGKPMLPWYPGNLKPDLHLCGCGNGFASLLPKPNTQKPGPVLSSSGVLRHNHGTLASLRSKQYLLGCVLEGSGSSRATFQSTLCVGANTKKLRVKCWLIMTLMQNLFLKTISARFCPSLLPCLNKKWKKHSI